MKRINYYLLLVVCMVFFCSFTAYAQTSMGEWVTDEGGTWYRYNDGTYPSASWLEKDGNVYFAKSDGYRAENTSIFDGKYSFDSEGVYLGDKDLSEINKSGHWEQDSVGWYFINEDGSCVFNNFVKLDTGTYAIGTDGYMLHDCYARNGAYFGSDGAQTSQVDNTAPFATNLTDIVVPYSNLVYPVDFLGGGFGINSVDGVSPAIAFRNNSGKTIKYIHFDLTPYNRVDDPVACTIRGYSATTCTATGPFEHEEGLGEAIYSLTSSLVFVYDRDTEHPYYYTSRTYKKTELDKKAYAKTFSHMPGWNCIWYNGNIYKIKLTKAVIEYMDGSSDIVPLDITMYHDRLFD